MTSAVSEFGQVSGTFTDPAYFSTTTDHRVAEAFARGADEGTTPTVLTVIGRDGVDVSPPCHAMRTSPKFCSPVGPSSKSYREEWTRTVSCALN
jgi:hypothetical protein